MLLKGDATDNREMRKRLMLRPLRTVSINSNFEPLEAFLYIVFSRLGQ